MTAAELRSAIFRAEAGDPLTDLRRQDPIYYRLHLQRRLALPVAPVLFALVGVPLAIRRDRGGRSWSVFTCVLVAFAYYALLTFGQALALDGAVSAAAALWLPNFVFAIGAGVALWRSNRVGFST
jgi:lipopolysaccharide export LptBFGC system permease protein LptF